MKVEIYRNASEREENRPYLIWTAKSLDQVQGYPIVRECVQQSYIDEGGTAPMTREYRVESIAFNQEFPRSTFSPELQPGAVVFDTIANKPAYQVPGAAQATDDTSHTHTASIANAIRAEQPQRWTDYAAPTSLGLGFAILATSLFLLWRRA